NAIPLIGTSQPITGRVDLARAIVAPLADLGTVDPTSQAEINACVRSLVMFPFANKFRPGFAVPRRDLALALVIGARVPQYLAGAPQYPDVQNVPTRLLVESAQAFPGGQLFPDATPGTTFNPNQAVDRLTAAVALVRAAGYTSEAELRAGTSLNLTDQA